MKGQSIKLAIACLQMIKDHHSGIGGVNLMDQKTPSEKVNWELTSGRYYLTLFFNLMDITLLNSNIVYRFIGPCNNWSPKLPCYSFITSFISVFWNTPSPTCDLIGTGQMQTVLYDWEGKQNLLSIWSMWCLAVSGDRKSK